MATEAQPSAAANLFTDCYIEGEGEIIVDDIQEDNQQNANKIETEDKNVNGGNVEGEEKPPTNESKIVIENTPRRSGRQRSATTKFIEQQQQKIDSEDAFVEVEVIDGTKTPPPTAILFTVGTTQKGGTCIFHEGYRYTHNSRNSWRCWKKNCWATVYGASKNENGQMIGFLGERPHTHEPDPEPEIFKYGVGRKKRSRGAPNSGDPYPRPRARQHPHFIRKREIIDMDLVMDEGNLQHMPITGTNSSSMDAPAPAQEIVVPMSTESRHHHQQQEVIVDNKPQPLRIIYTPADCQQNEHHYIVGHSQTTFLLDGITLTPGNVLIAIHGNTRSLAGQADNFSDNQLIRGKVICVGPRICHFGHQSATEAMPRPGDEVWVRGRNGFPVEMGGGERKLFVFNFWDIAMKLNNF